MACLALGGIAVAQCPREIGEGYVLTRTGGQSLFEVTSRGDDTVRATHVHQGRVATVSDYRRGLFGISTENAGGQTMTFEHRPADPPLALEVGSRTSFTIATMQGQTRSEGSATMSVVDREEVAIGDCRYDTLVIERRNESEADPGVFVRLNFSPRLRWILASRVEAPGGHVQEMRFSSIAPLKK